MKDYGKRIKIFRFAMLIAAAFLTAIDIMIFFLIHLAGDAMDSYAPSLTPIRGAMSCFVIPIFVLLLCGTQFITSTKKYHEPLISVAGISEGNKKLVDILTIGATMSALVGFAISIVFLVLGLNGIQTDGALFLVFFLASFLPNLIMQALLFLELVKQRDIKGLILYGCFAFVFVLGLPLASLIAFFGFQNDGLLIFMAGIPFFYCLYFLTKSENMEEGD